MAFSERDFDPDPNEFDQVQADTAATGGNANLIRFTEQMRRDDAETLSILNTSVDFDKVTRELIESAVPGALSPANMEIVRRYVEGTMPQNSARDILLRAGRHDQGYPKLPLALPPPRSTL